MPNRIYGGVQNSKVAKYQIFGALPAKYGLSFFFLTQLIKYKNHSLLESHIEQDTVQIWP